MQFYDGFGHALSWQTSFPGIDEENYFSELPPVLQQMKKRRPPTSECITYISGYLAFKIIRKLSCSNCSKILKKDSVSSTVLKFKSFTGAVLTEPSEALTRLVNCCESVFHCSWLEAFHGSSVVEKLKNCINLPSFPVNACHPELQNKIIKMFLILRTRQQCNLMSNWLKNNKRLSHKNK